MRKQVCEANRMWVDSREIVEDPRVGEEGRLGNECERVWNSEEICLAGEQGMWGTDNWNALSFQELPGEV